MSDFQEHWFLPSGLGEGQGWGSNKRGLCNIDPEERIRVSHLVFPGFLASGLQRNRKKSGKQPHDLAYRDSYEVPFLHSMLTRGSREIAPHM